VGLLIYNLQECTLHEHSTIDEFKEFMNSEYQAKIKTMRQTAIGMTKAAQQQFDDNSLQMKLICQPNGHRKLDTDH
jgi:hypothetical protein